MIEQMQIMQKWSKQKAPLVSIWCLAYNHEKYIRQTLEGFLNQETDFPFEIVVHDDASTDKTAQIIREYEKCYPDIIKPIYETENQYVKYNGSLDRIMREKCRGKYTAFCEGDDYWVDSQKLQKQITFLERNKGYFFSYSGFYCVDEHGNKINRIDFSYLRLLSRSGCILHNLIEKNFIMTLSFVCRSEILNSEICVNAPISLDYMFFLISATFGKAAYIDDKTCCYRKVDSSVTNAANKKIIEKVNQSFLYIAELILEKKINITKCYRIVVYNSIVVKMIDLWIKGQNRKALFFFVRKYPILFLFLPIAWLKEFYLLSKYYLYRFLMK